LGLAVGVGLTVPVAVGVAVAVALGVGVDVAVGVGVILAVAVAVTVGVALGVFVGVAVGDGLEDIVAVGVAVGVPLNCDSVTLTLSMRQPSLAPVTSLASRQRRRTGGPTKNGPVGRVTVVVMNPPELLLQARRPAIGLPRSVLIVRL
jgi:hypothetical protein